MSQCKKTHDLHVAAGDIDAPPNLWKSLTKIGKATQAKLTHTAGAYPSFRSTKPTRSCYSPWIGVSPIAGYSHSIFVRLPQQFNCTHLYSWHGWREAMQELNVLPKNTIQSPTH